jgi:hypothetical protein
VSTQLLMCCAMFLVVCAGRILHSGPYDHVRRLSRAACCCC